MFPARLRHIHSLYLHVILAFATLSPIHAKAKKQMKEKIYIFLLAFLPLVTLCSTEAEMYNIYLLNILIVIFTLSATIISLQKRGMIISYIDVILAVFVILSLLCAIKNDAPVHPYIYFNFCLTIVR